MSSREDKPLTVTVEGQEVAVVGNGSAYSTGCHDSLVSNSSSGCLETIQCTCDILFETCSA